MGKNVKKTKKSASKSEPAAEEAKLELPATKSEPVPEVDESETIKQKKETQKRLDKLRKACLAQVKEHIDLKQTIKAVECLQKYEKGGKKQLLDDDDGFIVLNFTLSDLPKHVSPKPHLVEISTPIYSKDRNTRVCLFVKDPARDFKDKIQDLDIPCVAKVIGFDKLRREFKQFKDKRSLVTEYDLFASDLRVYKMLPAVTGREFYKTKKFPVPIKIHDMEGKELETQLNSIATSTTFMQGNGPNYSVKVGRSQMEAKAIAKNLEQAVAQVLALLCLHEEDRVSFESVQQVTVSSAKCPVELPVFSQLKKGEVEAYY